MSSALVRFAFLSCLLSVPNLALADEKGAAAGAITGGVAGALVGGPIGAIIGAGIGGVAGGAVTGPATVQVEQPSQVGRERVLVRRPVPTEEPEATGSVVETTCVEDARRNRTCRGRRVR